MTNGIRPQTKTLRRTRHYLSKEADHRVRESETGCPIGSRVPTSIQQLFNASTHDCAGHFWMMNLIRHARSVATMMPLKLYCDLSRFQSEPSGFRHSREALHAVVALTASVVNMTPARQSSTDDATRPAAQSGKRPRQFDVPGWLIECGNESGPDPQELSCHENSSTGVDAKQATSLSPVSRPSPAGRGL